MSFIATPERDFQTWDFITGDVYKDMSIVVSRYYYLQNLDNKHSLKIAFRDPQTDKWTKWQAFPGLLWYQEKDNYGGNKVSHLTAAIDVHRSILSNEIVIESDYPTYEENYEATMIIGKILEEKGFSPLYYFSGNKSVHIHVFFNWNCLKKLDVMIQDQLRIMFDESKLKFKRKFIEWLRAKMISCWDTNAKKFDTDLIRATHLIRAELSRNKLGYKTFIGYSYKDLSFVPYICNEENRIYPVLGKIKLSNPNNLQELIVEFIESQRKDRKRQKAIEKKNRSLSKWIQTSPKKDIRDCVKSILSDDFKKVGDGAKRAMFILINELKDVHGVEQGGIIAKDWNARMNFPVKDEDIDYRLKQKNYSLSCDYIHKFLKELGVDVSKKCKGKVFK